MVVLKVALKIASSTALDAKEKSEATASPAQRLR